MSEVNLYSIKLVSDLYALREAQLMLNLRKIGPCRA